MTEVNFEYNVASDVDFEELIADIGFNDQLVAILTQEQGLENMRIRIYPPKNKTFWDFRLDEFEDIVNKAKTRLQSLKRL